MRLHRTRASLLQCQLSLNSCTSPSTGKSAPFTMTQRRGARPFNPCLLGHDEAREALKASKALGRIDRLAKQQEELLRANPANKEDDIPNQAAALLQNTGNQNQIHNPVNPIQNPVQSIQAPLRRECYQPIGQSSCSLPEFCEGKRSDRTER
jgi:hypothetical protein